MAKVCLDAGHFGNYNAGVIKGYYESVRMWKLQELLAAELQARGITVVKTRANQKSDLSLISRGKKAKGCDLFISLHSNAASTESPDYPVAYVLRENARTDIDERSADIGLKLAKVVEEVMGTKQTARTATRASANDRDGNGLKDDEYYGVLQGLKVIGVPGLILEHSFHTNKRATEWLLVDSNLDKLAEAEADVICRWLGLAPGEEKIDMKYYEYPEEIPAGELRDTIYDLVARGIIKGTGGGKLHLSEDMVRLLVYLVRAGVL